MESELNRRDLGRLLREKEKALLDMLDNHPHAKKDPKLDYLRAKVEKPTVEKHRTNRYELAKHAIAMTESGVDSALDMQAMMDQTVNDMNILREQKNKEIDDLRKELHEKNNLLEEHVSRLKTIKHYGSLLVRSSNIYVHKNQSEVSESDKSYLLKLSSTLSSLLDGRPIEKNSVKAFARRASLNAVPFDLTAQGEEKIRMHARDGEDSICDHEKSMNASDSSPSVRSPKRAGGTGVGRVAEGSAGAEGEDAWNSLKFLSLSDSGETMCDELFTTVYRLSYAKLEVVTDGVDGEERVVSHEDCPLVEVMDYWIGKRAFLSMCLVLDIIDDRLTMQVAVNCFEKAARDSFRGQMKLSNRLYLNDFVMCMTAAATFKYFGDGQDNKAVGSQKDRISIARLNRLLEICIASPILKNPAAYIEMTKIFNRVSGTEIFNKLAPRQVFLTTAYKRSRNYVTRTAEKESTYIGPSGKIWPSKTAANGGAANRDRGELTQGSGFYNFCRVYRIFPVLTSDSVVRRISQHVRKMSDDGTAAFLACLVYMSLSLANNISETAAVSESELHKRVAEILERVIVQTEGITLHTAVGKAPVEEGAAKLTDIAVVESAKRRSSTYQLKTRKIIAQGMLMSSDVS